MILLGFFSGALNHFKAGRVGRLAQLGGELGRGKAGPLGRESLLREPAATFLKFLGVGFGDQQIKRGVLLDMGKDLLAVMLLVGEDQGALGAFGIHTENLLSQREQLRSGLSGGASGGGKSEAKGLGGIGVQAEEGLGHFNGLGVSL